MDVEGCSDIIVTEDEVIEFMNGEGWIASNVEIWFDILMLLWLWRADIESNK